MSICKIRKLEQIIYFILSRNIGSGRNDISLQPCIALLMLETQGTYLTYLSPKYPTYKMGRIISTCRDVVIIKHVGKVLYLAYYIVQQKVPPTVVNGDAGDIK